MKRKLGRFLFPVLIFAGSFLASCSEKTPETGNLTVTVEDATNQKVVVTMLHLAVSYDDLKAGNYYRDQYTTEAGTTRFAELPPREYWYKAEGHDELGSILVYAGKDYFVTLYVNSPKKSIK